ncbi:oxidoreductase [mine drainage metagenome]|uniref:Oxidoreductase n=1 Tax=mine drainage metagenome TaxID=410659 RepID=T0ZC24_9ZZZZ
MEKVILITGAGRGIGHAIASSLYNGNSLILLTKTKDSHAKLKKEFPKALCYRCDITSDLELRKTLKDVESNFRSIDVLVNNAGIFLGKEFEKTGLKEFDNVFSVLIRAPFAVTTMLLPLLKKSKYPQVVTISSAAAFAPMVTESVYSAAKSGVSTLMEVAREELQKYKIRFTLVEPFGVNSHNIPNPKNLLHPEDIGDLVKYIINTDRNCEILTVSLSTTGQWFRGTPPWFKG